MRSLIGGLALLITSSIAFAGNCAPRDKILKVLKDKYNEAAVGTGTIREVFLTEVFVSEDHTTWSIISTDAQGLTCIIGAGQDWNFIKPRTKGKSL